MRDIQKRIEPVVSRVKKERPDLNGNELTTVVVKANMLQSRQDLLTSSPEIARMASDGKIRILTAVYNMGTGAVEWVDMLDR